MARTLKWEDDPNQNRNSNKKELNFLKMLAGSVYKIRPLGYAVEFDKYMVQREDGTWRSAVCENRDTCPVKAKYGIDPSTRYAMNVIDRMDNRVKILEFPFSIYKEIRKYRGLTGEDPGGPNCADFEVKVTGNGKGRKYDVECNGKSPISAETMEIIMTTRIFKLEDVYKPVDSDKIEDMLFGNVGGSAPKPKNVTPIQTPSPVNTVNEDVLVDEADIPF